MTYNHNRKYVVVILAEGESQRPRRLLCVNNYCRRTLLMVNRDVKLVIDNNKGVHWSDLPEDVTVIEYKCRGCDFYYKIYTPETSEARRNLNTMIDTKSNV